MIYSEWESSDPATPLWFLLSLFFVKCVYNAIYKYKHKDLMCLVLMGCGFALSSFGAPIRALNASLVGIFFFALGKMERDRNVLLYKNSRKENYVVVGCCILIVIISLINGRVDMNAGQYNNILLFIIGSLAGIAVVVIVAQRTIKYQILSVLGRNSLTIYLLHMYVVVILQCIEMRFDISMDTKIKIINKLLSFVIMGMVIVVSEVRKGRSIK